MSPQMTAMLGICAMMFVVLVFVGIWASRYVKVGLNQVMIVSGRERRLQDGTQVGFRIVKGGGTFVLPVIEKADFLSLEIMGINLPRVNLLIANRPATVDCAAQVKIKADDFSIATAAQYFLNKAPAEVNNVIQPIFEKHLSSALAGSTAQQVQQDPASCARRVEAAAAPDLEKMGMTVVSFSIRNVSG